MPRTENSRTLFFISAEICLILLLSVGQGIASPSVTSIVTFR